MENGRNSSDRFRDFRSVLSHGWWRVESLNEACEENPEQYFDYDLFALPHEACLDSVTVADCITRRHKFHCRTPHPTGIAFSRSMYS